MNGQVKCPESYNSLNFIIAVFPEQLKLGESTVLSKVMLRVTIFASYLTFLFAYTKQALNDQITSFPRAESLPISNQFSGFLNVSSNKYIHYMYFESENDPTTDSIIFWTNGGPGMLYL